MGEYVKIRDCTVDEIITTLWASNSFRRHGRGSLGQLAWQPRFAHMSGI
ncbi:MAG TPA: hypothetical protein VKG22_04460 [Stellaceae bacterium]|nr:hypothetical protein [Stellaceae bacterium]HMD65885.1 hypothetical protein [Stellaceae bacterium]